MNSTKKQAVHLVCNAHLDPVWLWQWPEGAAEAISTFRTAADFCEQYEGFVFNHNEVILYQWVQEYEPALFKRIQKLVKQGKWHIMGGWYLQPDCNMPCGESFVRQILLGRQYFKKHFGVEPKTAINFDPFGHSRGLVQILAKSGYDSYLFCRPRPEECTLPDDQFIWLGYDGSAVMATRSFEFYCSARGDASDRVTRWLNAHSDRKTGIVLWGIGNHGGGPSRIDLEQITQLIKQTKDCDIRHSTPEAYFQQLDQQRKHLPCHHSDLNPFAVGCYTSQIRIKQKHRQLENELYMTEKMATAATVQGLMKYPRREIRRATQDLLFGQFHDILPGSSIQPTEEDSLQLFDHGLEELARIKTRAFFALASGQKKSRPNQIPILVYNPHPYKIRGVITCEFQLPDQNLGDSCTLPSVYSNGKKLPSQLEKEHCNLSLDWRKCVVFQADLEPSRMNRFDCKMQVLPRKPRPALKARNGKIHFRTSTLDIIINTRTGLVDRYRVNGRDMIRPGAFRPIVMHDNADTWGMRVDRFRRVAGRFRLLTKKQAAQFSSLARADLPAVRVIEDGPVRSVVEAMFAYENSFICQHYKLPKHGTQIEIQTRVHWNQSCKMLKLAVPVIPHEDARYIGQTAYGVADLPSDGREAVAQKWVAVVSKRKNLAITCINTGVYGSDFDGRELRLSLLRSPAYSGHPIEDRPIAPDDRHTPCIDQGERFFSFYFNSGSVSSRLGAVDREALVANEAPPALSFFPAQSGKLPKSFITLSDNVVQITAMKMAESGNDLIIRLFEPTGRKRHTTISLPSIRLTKKLTLNRFEIRTLRIGLKSRHVTDNDLLERK